MGNEFQEREQLERDAADTRNVGTLIQLVKDLIVLVKDVSKEQRVIREELRNIENLRPLRKKGEEVEETLVEETPVGSSGEQIK